MPNLLALSFEGQLAPSIDLRCLHPGHRLPDGWGIGYYPGGEPSASVLKEPAPPQGSIRSELVRAWEHLDSSIFLLHIRQATWGAISDANTQPFCLSLGGRDWLIGHSGSLRDRLEPPSDPRFEPVGSTDTETIFCRFMYWVALEGARSLGDLDAKRLHRWFGSMNGHGGLTVILTDGRDVAVYTDKLGEGDMYLWRVTPPYPQLVFGDGDVEVDLTRRGAKSRKGVILSSAPLESATGDADWTKIPPGTLLMIRQGAIRVEIRDLDDAPASDTGSPERAPQRVLRPKPADVQRFQVVHRTTYAYTRPVEKSTHVLRLAPVHDRLQTLLSHETSISVPGQSRRYEDVFGNQTERVLIDTPFTELVIEARSRVELLDTDPLAYRPLKARFEHPPRLDALATAHASTLPSPARVARDPAHRAH